MQQQYNENLRLMATPHSHVFTVALGVNGQTRYIGKLDQAGEGTFMANRTEKHLHRNTNSLGLNLELLHSYDFKWIVLTYCGRRLITTRNFILYHGRVMTFGKAGYEKQCFLGLDLWGEERAIAFERTLTKQGDLFKGAA